ncbi:GNAT family N-acetyltransferase [Kitasatospora sp. GAS204B]|uniref:GNAT family N-acetyltransferase n=1 Tax=unclassified Kitasatospora TaxID=2633591 RepID=UPI0024770AA8|nr:GNAT family N-acetyltransferase [Kitasatospora sp. GAS204B]MDH6119840.1 GNAT superfamily N-acetyltransferase [Kitasatospora sp. GAS204B]
MSVQARANNLTGLRAQHRSQLILHQGTDPTIRAFGAMVKDELVGFSYGAPTCQQWHWVRLFQEALSAWDHPVDLEDSFAVLELHVLPHWQCHGIGEALLRSLCAVATEPWAVLTTLSPARPAHRLYQKLGFCDLAPPGHISGKSYTLMGRPLPLPPRGLPPWCR